MKQVHVKFLMEGEKMENNKPNKIKTSLEKTPVTYGIVLRGLPADLQELLEYIEQSKIAKIYEHASYGKLYVLERED